MDVKLIGQRLTYFLLAIFLVDLWIDPGQRFPVSACLRHSVSYLLYPIVNFLEKKGVPRIFSILLTIVIALALFAALAIFVLKRISLFMDELPVFQGKDDQSYRVTATLH